MKDIVNCTKELLKIQNFNFKKSLGQNFLNDENILKKIMVLSEITNESSVIEIGAGSGQLTKYITASGAQCLAIEIDKRLVFVLSKIFFEFKNIKVINADIMKLNFNLLKELFGAGYTVNDLVIVGNLPYYLATAIILKIINEKLDFSRMVFTVQKEVAQKLVAHPFSANYGSLSVLVQCYLKCEILFHINPTSFAPKPKVISSVVKIEKNNDRVFLISDDYYFAKIVRAAFSHRRKTIMNSLLKEQISDKRTLQESLNSIKCQINQRAEELSIAQFAELSNILFENLKNSRGIK